MAVPALAIALAACGSSPDTGQGGTSVPGLMGRPVDEAVASLGPHYETTPLEGGGKIYTWKLVREFLESGGRGPPALGVSSRGTGTYNAGQRRAPRMVAKSCRLSLHTDPEGQVTGFEAAGEACADILRRGG